MPVCEDAMTFAYECPNQPEFFDGNQMCGNNMDPIPCAGSQMPTQNSHAQLTAALGACPD